MGCKSFLKPYNKRVVEIKLFDIGEYKKHWMCIFGGISV